MQCNNIVTIKDDVNIIALITGEGRDSRQLYAKKPTATISHHSPILWRRFEGQRGHYEISTLDLSDPGYKEIRLEAFDNLNQVKNLIINERRDANIKIFDARMARLKQELINELQISGVKTKLDVEILKFQQNLLNYGDLAENTRRATDALKICIEKEIQARERARLAQAIYDELVAEGARLEKEFAEVGVDLRPELRKARKNAVTSGLTLEEGKAMMRTVAKNLIEKEVQARNRAQLAQAIYDELITEGANIEKEFEEFDIDLRPELRKARKNAVTSGLTLEEGKAMMWDAAKIIIDATIKSQQKYQTAKELMAFIDEICSTSEHFKGKGRALLENALDKILHTVDLDISATKNHLVQIAMNYLENIAVAWELQDENSRKAEARAWEIDHLMDDVIKNHPGITRKYIYEKLSSITNNNTTIENIKAAIDKITWQWLASQTYAGRSLSQSNNKRKRSKTPAPYESFTQNFNKDREPNQGGRRIPQGPFNSVLADKLLLALKQPSPNNQSNQNS